MPLNTLSRIWKSRKWLRRMTFLTLLMVSGYFLVDYLYMVRLRAFIDPQACYELISPDGRYILKTCIMQTYKRYSLIHYNDIANKQIFDRKTGQLLQETPLYEVFSVGMQTVWRTCDEVLPEKRPPQWSEGQVCHVQWARNMGDLNRPDYEYKTYLPPSKWMQFRAKLP